jgi:hypothetical protein
MTGRKNPDGRATTRRAVIVAFVFVASLAAAYVVVRTMMDTSRLQDCAASGRRDC